MRRSKGVGFGLAAGAALLFLTGCVSQQDVDSLRQEVSALSARVDAAETTAANAQAASERCTAICEETSAKADRMFQESLRK
jgi:outer membrane murein-binding lipoprotein Lpp